MLTRAPLALAAVLFLTAVLYGFDILPRYSAILVAAGGCLVLAARSFQLAQR